ncbi:hypothetical protein [Burkholderia alba]|uniref:hypothetical protein n=1 Tax=Burkholderia alba TaxID=2683677 RepID=UPI002B051A70|nr:hypothetical protein [Burkholderia alba]
MKPSQLILHCLGRKDGDQWVVMCLDFSLAEQTESFDEARKLLDSQISAYLNDALIGLDREHAADLLHRRAPLKYWAQFYLARCAHGITNNKLVKAFREPVPMKPVHA